MVGSPKKGVSLPFCKMNRKSIPPWAELEHQFAKESATVDHTLPPFFTGLEVFIEFPHLYKWRLDNPLILTKVNQFFDDSLQKSLLESIPNLPSVIEKIIREYVLELPFLFDYFYSCTQRIKKDFYSSLRQLRLLLYLEKHANADVKTLYDLLIENGEDNLYAMQYYEANCYDHDDTNHFWSRWLNKMDYVFKRTLSIL